MEKLNKDELFTLSIHLDLSSLFNFSLSNKYIYKNVSRDQIWIYRLNTDFPDFKKLEVDKSFREIYRILYSLIKVKREFIRKENIYELYNLKGFSSPLNQLTKISKEIDCLINLETLYLSNNQLTKVPKEIGNLTNLKILSLSNNRLIEIPKEIGNLTNLEILYLSYNYLTEIPKEIGNLANLERLNLSYNRLTEIPKEIDNLMNLKTLELYGNRSIKIPKEIFGNKIFDDIHI